jgi:hypothetical protein
MGRENWDNRKVEVRVPDRRILSEQNPIQKRFLFLVQELTNLNFNLKISFVLILKEIQPQNLQESNLLQKH